jgi:transcriptional regulator GlxA family with amidase domain
VRTSSRTVAVLLFDEVELWDVAALMQVASLAGRHWNWRPFRLLPTAEKAGWIETRSQLRIEAQYTFGNCPEPEILLVPGGYGARRAAQNALVTDWCARVWPRLELALAIGSGVLVLGAAGLIDGEEVAVSAENLEAFSASLPNTRCIDPKSIDPKSIDSKSLDPKNLDPKGRAANGVLPSPSGKLLSCTGGEAALELGLALVERCLGARLAGNLRHSVLPPPTTRLELSEQKLELPLPPQKLPPKKQR